jgi:RHS repeat-associated protein
VPRWRASTRASGTLTSQQRYLPFGQVRTVISGPITQTDFGYTGQRANSYIKLLDYRSRWLDPQLGRFVSPDSIISNPANPQSFNRYSYVNNSPIRFNDPTGHEAGSCYDRGYCEAGETWSSIVHPAPVVIIACGVGENVTCKHGTPGSMDPYEKLSRNVYRVPLGPWDDGVKYDSADDIKSIVDAYPSSPIIIVGHSAGADAATLAYSDLTDTQKQQTKLILLDPTMTAGTHDPARPGETDYSPAGALSSTLQNSATDKRNVFIYDSNRDYINGSPTVLSDYGFKENAPNYTYVYQEGIDHMALAGSGLEGQAVFDLAVDMLQLTPRP